MTDEFDPEGYFLDDMSEEEKDQLIGMLSAKYNHVTDIVVALHNSLSTFATQLLAGDYLGGRGDAMRSVAYRMDLVAAITRAQLGIDEDQLRTDMQFDDIVANFEEDD